MDPLANMTPTAPTAADIADWQASAELDRRRQDIERAARRLDRAPDRADLQRRLRHTLNAHHA